MSSTAMILWVEAVNALESSQLLLQLQPDGGESGKRIVEI